MKSLKYQDLGIDDTAKNPIYHLIKPLAEKTTGPNVLSGVGGLAALYEIPPHRYQAPVLVSACDSVGTKARLAASLKRNENIGIDVVAMCVNDILACGAQPLYFLDYFGSGRSHPSMAPDILQGITKGCLLAEMSLIGGETTEMPGIYNDSDYDLVGFVVGIVEKSRIIDGSQVKDGDILIALPSSGIHTHGFSLIQRLITEQGIDLQQTFGVQTLGETLLTPSRIYVRTLLPLVQGGMVAAAAPIKEGGITGSLAKVLPKTTEALIDFSHLELPPIFEWVKTQASLDMNAMLNQFNCGIGMILVIAKEKVDEVMTHLRAVGEQPRILGYIQTSLQASPRIIYE